jgi:hypothetical protein
MFSQGSGRLLPFSGSIRLVAIAATAAFLAVGGLWATAGVVGAQDRELEFLIQPISDLKVLRGTITEGAPAHIQITIINSKLNDVSISGEIVLTLPSTLLAHSTTDGATGGAVKNLIEITNPIASGTAETYDIWVQASPESPRYYKIDAEVITWPLDPLTMIADKTNVHREKLRPETGSVVSATDSGWSGCASIECASESELADCDELSCKPWGWFLVGYAAIASVMVSVVTVRSFINRY